MLFVYLLALCIASPRSARDQDPAGEGVWGALPYLTKLHMQILPKQGNGREKERKSIWNSPLWMDSAGGSMV